MLVDSYLNPHDLRVCTTQLCSSGAGFVASLFKNDTTTIRLQKLVACCRLSRGVDDVPQESIKRIESFLARRGNVRTVILDAHMMHEFATKASVYSGIHRRVQQGSSFQLSQSQGITVQWHVSAKSIAQVKFLLEVDMPKDGAHVSGSSVGGAARQYLHTLDLWRAEGSDVSVLASCKLLHTLDLASTLVIDVAALASCQSLHTLNLQSTLVRDVRALSSCQSLHSLDLSHTQVSDLSALASCQNLHTLDLWGSAVSDVSALGSCQSLHTLYLMYTQVSDVSAFVLCRSLHTLDLTSTQVSDVTALASCQSLHALSLMSTQVSDVTALASCQSLHTLDLRDTQVSDVSELASCLSLRQLWGADGMIGCSDILRIIKDRG
jgi:hypothetical protein